MKVLLILVLSVAAPVLYLWQHACSFRLCQDIARLQEQRQRVMEQRDSLQSCVDNLGSRTRIGSYASTLGLESKFGPRAPLQVPVMVAAAPAGKPSAPAKSRTMARAKPVEAGRTGSGLAVEKTPGFEPVARAPGR